MPAALRSMLKTAPKLSDAKAAKARLQDVLQDEEAGAQCAALLREKPVHALLTGLADQSRLESDHIAYKLGPRLNAAGRMATSPGGIGYLCSLAKA